MGKTSEKHLKRVRRKLSIRKKLRGSAERPRMTVFRSARHIYVQIIDDESGATMFSASTLQEGDGGMGGNLKAAGKVGEAIGKKAIQGGVSTVVFDRNGYLYHGRVKALADAAREAGLVF